MDCPSASFISGRIILFSVMDALSAAFLGSRKIGRTMRYRNKHVLDPKGTIDFGLLGVLGGLVTIIVLVYVTANRTLDEGGMWYFFALWSLLPSGVICVAFMGYSREYTGHAIGCMIIHATLSIITAQLPMKIVISGGEYDGDFSSWSVNRIGATITIVSIFLMVILAITLMLLKRSTLLDVRLSFFKICGAKDDTFGDSGTVGWSKRDTVWYTVFVTLFTSLFAGRWIMWATMSAGFSCPIWSREVDLIWCLGPFGIRFVMAFINGITA